MIPRNLPGLTAAAIRNGWSVEVLPLEDGIDAEFWRDRDRVILAWSLDARLTDSEINNVPTPYAQCVRLIRTKETR